MKTLKNLTKEKAKKKGGRAGRSVNLTERGGARGRGGGADGRTRRRRGGGEATMATAGGGARARTAGRGRRGRGRTDAAALMGAARTGTAWTACGDGGERRARTVANGGGGDGFFRQHLPCIFSPPRASMCSGEEKGAAYRGSVIGPGLWLRPGPMTHCSRVETRPGTYEAQSKRRFPLLARKASLVPGNALARDQ